MLFRSRLPAALSAADLPPALRMLVEPSANSHIALDSEAPLVHLQMLAGWALGTGLDLPDIEVRRPSLEDVYLSLTDSSRE